MPRPFTAEELEFYRNNEALFIPAVNQKIKAPEPGQGPSWCGHIRAWARNVAADWGRCHGEWGEREYSDARNKAFHICMQAMWGKESRRPHQLAAADLLTQAKRDVMKQLHVVKDAAGAVCFPYWMAGGPFVVDAAASGGALAPTPAPRAAAPSAPTTTPTLKASTPAPRRFNGLPDGLAAFAGGIVLPKTSPRPGAAVTSAPGTLSRQELEAKFPGKPADFYDALQGIEPTPEPEHTTPSFR